MQLHNESSETYVPSGEPVAQAIARTTHMAVAAHQDDIEIMAYHGVLECFGKSDNNLMGVTVTNGGGSARDGIYADYTDEDMMKIRRMEQKKAAFVGEYCAHAFLDYKSSEVKDAANPNVVDDLKTLISAAKPKVIYTHNLADKHDTHVSVALRTIAALRELSSLGQDFKSCPSEVYGCEVWRDLDWLLDSEKVVLDVAGHENLAASLLGVFDSQVAGGKRYDLASMGRRRANATYFESHGVDVSTGLTFAMDLTPLIQDPSLDPASYVASFISRFADEVRQRLAKFS
jgi:LmbE family N-acetylglucosaminyl deacetylase